MSDSDDKYSVDALDGFLEYLADKGLMPKPTVAARRAACNKMLGVLSEVERQDVRSLDLDDVSTRFNNLEGKNYTPDSLKTYKSRASKAIEDFLRYLDNPAAFKSKANPSKKLAEINKTSQKNENFIRATLNGDQSPHPEAPEYQGLVIPVPIREHLIVRISGLPYDLTHAEATKIANVVKAMVALEE